MKLKVKVEGFVIIDGSDKGLIQKFGDHLSEHVENAMVAFPECEKLKVKVSLRICHEE